MLSYLTKKLLYGLLVMAGVIVVVFFLFQGFGDPSRLVMGQTADAATQQNIRKELYLDQPKWKQFFAYINDVSPVAVHSNEEIQRKQLKGIFIGGENNLALKLPLFKKVLPIEKRCMGCIDGSTSRHYIARSSGHVYCYYYRHSLRSACGS